MASNFSRGDVKQHLVPIPLMLFSGKNYGFAILLRKEVGIDMTGSRRILFSWEIRKKLSRTRRLVTKVECNANIRLAR